MAQPDYDPDDPDGGPPRSRHRDIETMNDDRSPLLTLISCIDCQQTMRLETSHPGEDGKDIIQYRCQQCGRIELISLVRGSWPASR